MTLKSCTALHDNNLSYVLMLACKHAKNDANVLISSVYPVLYLLYILVKDIMNTLCFIFPH